MFEIAGFLLLSVCLASAEPACEPVIEREEGYRLPEFRLSEPVPSPKGNKVAFIAGHSYQDEEIMVWDVARDTVTNVTRNFGKRSCYGRLLWSPRGDAIAAPLHPLPGMGNSLHVLYLDGLPERVLGGSDVPEYAWSPDGRRMAYADVDRHLYVVDVDQGKPKRLTRQQRLAVHDLTWWHDGKREVIAFIAGWLGPEKNVFIAPLDGSGEKQITQEGNYGYLALMKGGENLNVLRLTGEQDPPMEAFQISKISFRRRSLGEVGKYKNILQGNMRVLSANQSEVRGAGRLLRADRVECLCFRQRLEEGKKRMAEQGFRFIPDPRKVRRQDALVSLPSDPIPFHNTTVVTEISVTPEEFREGIELGSVFLETGGVEVKPSESGNVEVRVLLRWLDRIGQSYLETGEPRAFPMELQEQSAPGKLDKGVQCYYRQYSVAAVRISVDPATGVWSEMTFQLLRYDETQGIPTIERGIEPEIDLDVKRPEYTLEEAVPRKP